MGTQQSHTIVQGATSVTFHNGSGEVPGDRPLTQRLKFYAPQKLSNKQSLTTEGFLLCEDVPIARIGTQLYARGEVPVDADNDGIIRIERSVDEVFRPETIASFMGKPVTNDHPTEDVTPENWQELAVGVVQNVRRGTGILDDFIIADLLITEKEAIAAVRDGKREVSCGYDADYEQTSQGRGLQRNIIGNHVALVEQGRAGSRCAIQDRSSPMKKTLRERVLDAFTARDAKALDEALQGSEDPDTHVHVHLNNAATQAQAAHDNMDINDPAISGDPEKKTTDDDMGAKLDAILELLKKLLGDESTEDAEPEDKDDKKDEEGKTTDAMKDFTVRAELLVPSFSAPTRDAKKVKFADHLQHCKRKVLEAAFLTKDGQAIIKAFVGDKPDFAKLSAATVDAAFTGASEVAKHTNNGNVKARTVDNTVKPLSIDDINKRNAEFWSTRR